ncbi:MAG: hydrogenase maturation nickel metallochaperone HypA [Lewinellaceae bacterium]|nr:hydrogenase maturation nickel metallochaperone HypA [Lewinellaceae bacterium]
MHELSLVLNIIDIATAEVHRAGGGTVTEIELEIGALAGVERAALDFAWETAVRNTVLENSVLTIHAPLGQARCMDCETAFTTNNLFTACPTCGSYFCDITGGRELKVKRLILDQEPVAAGSLHP